MAETRYIFITQSEGVSHVRGVMASSIAMLLQSCGYSVAVMKLNVCLNTDTDGQSEIFVTADGCETDIELGRYERFTGIETSSANIVTAGKVYQNVINRGRRGDYQGDCVRVVPHVTDEIKRNVCALSNSAKSDFLVVELGGVAGELDTLPFVEALRQLKNELEQSCVWMHVAHIDNMQMQGIQPDVMILQAEQELLPEERETVAMQCGVDENYVFQPCGEAIIYEMPLLLKDVAEVVQRKVGVDEIRFPQLAEWNDLVQRINEATENVTIGIVGTGIDKEDVYCSLKESLQCVAAHQDRKLNVCYVEATFIHDGNVEEMLGELDGVIIAPDGKQGFEGKIVATKWCREHDMITLGIAEGMHCMAIEYARNVLGIQEANSTEIDARTPHNIIDMMMEKKNRANMWGAKRVGVYSCNLIENTTIGQAYGLVKIKERHCHSFELNNSYCDAFEQLGMICAGVNTESGLIESIESRDNTWYVGVQFRPEFAGTALNPNPLLMDFVKEIKTRKK